MRAHVITQRSLQVFLEFYLVKGATESAKSSAGARTFEPDVAVACLEFSCVFKLPRAIDETIAAEDSRRDGSPNDKARGILFDPRRTEDTIIPVDSGE